MTLVYDHHSHDLADKLTEHQHTHHEEIVSTLHVHLDADHCLEVVVLRGVARDIKRIADGLIGTKGVQARQVRGDDDRRRSPEAGGTVSSVATGLSALDRLDRLARLDTPVHRVDPRAKVVATAVFIVCVVSYGKYELLGLLPFALFPVCSGRPRAACRSASSAACCSPCRRSRS